MQTHCTVPQLQYGKCSAIFPHLNDFTTFSMNRKTLKSPVCLLQGSTAKPTWMTARTTHVTMGSASTKSTATSAPVSLVTQVSVWGGGLSGERGQVASGLTWHQAGLSLPVSGEGTVTPSLQSGTLTCKPPLCSFTEKI